MTAHGDTVRAVKRRGILAAAEAVVAGIVAKQAARPVAASTPLLIANTETAGVTNPVVGPTFLYDTASYTDPHALLSVGILDGSAKAAIHGSTNGVPSAPPDDVCGIFGSTGDTSVGRDQGTVGVLGQTGKGGGVGVKGVVTAVSAGGAIGVFGANASLAPDNIGVGGITFIGVGTKGHFHPASTAPNTIGVYGLNQSSGAGGIGVRGDAANIGVFGATNTAASPAAAPGGCGVQGVSDTGIGVYGITAAAYQYAVCGQALVDNAFGITGIANGNNCVAFAGATSNPSAFAASFQGHVQVFGGAFDVLGAGNKHALVPHPDGTHRTIYSIEAPECWVEDFGEGTLSGGRRKSRWRRSSRRSFTPTTTTSSSPSTISIMPCM